MINALRGPHARAASAHRSCVVRALHWKHACGVRGRGRVRVRVSLRVRVRVRVRVWVRVRARVRVWVWVRV